MGAPWNTEMPPPSSFTMNALFLGVSMYCRKRIVWARLWCACTLLLITHTSATALSGNETRFAGILPSPAVVAIGALARLSSECWISGRMAKVCLKVTLGSPLRPIRAQ